MNDWNHRPIKRDFTKNVPHVEESTYMEHISHALNTLYAWYYDVVNEIKGAKDYIKHLEATLETCTHETDTIKNLEKQLDLSREVSNCFERRVRELEGELQDKEDNFKFLQGVVENRLKREMEIKEQFAQMRAQIRTLEQERDEALDELNDIEDRW